jgi:hypothetical protein
MSEDTGFGFIIGWCGGLALAGFMHGNPAAPLVALLGAFLIYVKLRLLEQPEE